MGDAKGQYAAEANSTVYLSSPVKGDPLFLPEIEHLQTLYPKGLSTRYYIYV